MADDGAASSNTLRLTRSGRALLGTLALTLPLSCSLTPRPWPEAPDKEVAAASEEAGDTQGELDWSYSGQNGPSAWAGLQETWADCGKVSQSPVDLPLTALTEPSPDKKPTPREGSAVEPPFAATTVESQLGTLPLQVKSDGRLVTIHGANSQILNVGGKPASLDRIELHRPAEHRLGGVEFDFEMVLWFSRAGDVPVGMSLLFRKGAENAVLGPLLNQLPKERVYNKTSIGSQLALSELFNHADPTFLSYWGSLSAPPCTEGIPRLVFARVGEISEAQLKLLVEKLPDASRPLQALGDRAVGLVPLVQEDSALVAPAAGTPAATPPSPSASSKPGTSPKSTKP